MTKDEMKNRISMALKDPILQQGFECICKENAELRKVAEFQQSSNMDTHIENKKLKEVLAVGTTCNKGLIARNKFLEEESDKYRNMVFDKIEQLDKAIDIIQNLCGMVRELNKPNVQLTNVDYSLSDAEQFLNSEVEK